MPTPRIPRKMLEEEAENGKDEDRFVKKERRQRGRCQREDGGVREKVETLIGTSLYI